MLIVPSCNFSKNCSRWSNPQNYIIMDWVKALREFKNLHRFLACLFFIVFFSFLLDKAVTDLSIRLKICIKLVLWNIFTP